MDDHFADAVGGVPLLQGEAIEMVLDTRKGLVAGTGPSDDVVVVTSRRVMRCGAAEGGRVVSVFPLRDLAAVEVWEHKRSFGPLGWGMALLAAGLALGWFGWFVVHKHLLVVLPAGLSIAMGIRISAGWTLRDTMGTLRLYGRGHAVELPLRTAVARQSAYAVLRRVCELRWWGHTGDKGAVEASSTPAREEPERPRTHRRRWKWRASGPSRKPTGRHDRPLRRREGLCVGEPTLSDVENGATHDELA